MNNMLRFLKKSSKVDEERERLKKELFKFTRCVDHGFPNKPSALAYDPKLQLLAVGTKNGTIKIYGAPGVEFTGNHEDDVAINHLYFLPEQGRVVSLCSDNSLHLWEINVKDGISVLEEVKKISMESNKMKTMSMCCLSQDHETLLLGTEGGNIHILDLKEFVVMEQVIYQDVVMQNVPDDFRVTPGAVEAISVHPLHPNQILIGYNRGLIVLWDNDKSEVIRTYNASQQLESISWHYNGEEFMASHADGSYVVWSLDSDTPKNNATPYGPFPCKGISKILWKTSKGEPITIFCGGMPRASYGDRHTVSVMQGESHTVFDFTSRVIDFITLQHSDVSDDRIEHEDPHTLVVLVEEELVVIDLETDGWPVFPLPYMNSVHSSAITCSQHIANVPTQLWEKLTDAGVAQNKGVSTRDWPINGGKNLTDESNAHDLLLTGHEDGTIRFWEASGTALRFIYKVSSGIMFGMDHTADASAEEEEWPPFRKVGSFDPYSDDPRLGIQKISLCPLSETLVVAGTAGQVIVLQMERDERQLDVKALGVNLITDREDFVWKGHDALTASVGERKYASGFQPSVIVQLSPPAACTSLTLHSEWQLLAVGTSHGFALFDYAQSKDIFTRCTLSRTDTSGTNDSTMSRRKSFQKSLRDSFRRIRKGRSERRKKRAEEASGETPKKEGAPAAASIEATPSADAAAAATTDDAAASPDRRPVERQIEARSNDDYKSSLVRCVYLVDTFISHAHTHTPSLWVGTNAGHIYVHILTVPTSDKRSSENITCTLAKEIKLRHRAPVVAMSVIDQHSRILPDPLEVQNERAKEADMTGHHQVVICSEEQFKLFSLPQLRPVGKVRITSTDGSSVRKVGFTTFRSKTDEAYTENDISCLTNLGDVAVYSIPSLKKQMTATCAKKEDINGISSFIFTKSGQGFYMSSSSEVSRVSLSTTGITRPNCEVELKEGMRPPPPEPEVEPQGGAGIEITIDPAPPVGEDPEMAGAAAGVDAVTLDEQNESRADTTADITVDSVTVNPDVSADISADSGDVVTSSEVVEEQSTRTIITTERVITSGSGEMTVTGHTVTGQTVTGQMVTGQTIKEGGHTVTEQTVTERGQTVVRSEVNECVTMETHTTVSKSGEVTVSECKSEVTKDNECVKVVKGSETVREVVKDNDVITKDVTHIKTVEYVNEGVEVEAS